MRPRFQADENLNAKIIAGVLRREPSIEIGTAQNAGLLGTSDAYVLTVGAREGRIVITHDRATMPEHFANFIKNSASPGVLIVSPKLGIHEAIEQILLIWAASEAEEWVNRIGYIPL